MPEVEPRRDIRDRTDIAELVEAFYRRVFVDELIGPIFTDVARLDLSAHLPVMCDFWETVLLRAGRYRGNALQVHRVLNERTPLRVEHFERWLAIWHSTVDDRYAGAVAVRAKTQATRIAGSLLRRIQGHTPGEFATIPPRAGMRAVAGGEPGPAPRMGG